MIKQIICFVLIAVLYLNCQSKEQPKQVKKPNILFAISDDQSFPHAGAYGCRWVKTPAFDRVAKEGLLFHKAYTPNAKCSPSRACILTGRNSWQLEEAANHVPFFPEKFKTFTEALKEHDYYVGRTGKGWAPGVAMLNGQPRELIGKNFMEYKIVPPAEFISNNDYTKNFESFLSENKNDLPFFFWYGASEPHRKYEYKAGVKKGNKQLTDVNHIPEFWPDVDSIRNDMLDYAFEIEHFDKHLSNMLELLEQRGELDNTIVIVTSDNGMPFPRIKGQIYEYDNHLPLAIMWKNGINDSGRQVTDFVNFIDFAPTILDAADVEEVNSGMQAITGSSLYDVFLLIAKIRMKCKPTLF